jgi:FlaA1/EpsC-like NDP-sugar epimerase
MKASGLQVDERNATIFGRVCIRMYLVTIGCLWLDVLYRQLWRHQPVAEFMDIAIVLSANVIVAIAAILYFGGITIPRFRASIIAFFYATCVVAGTAFWLAKDPEQSLPAILGKALVVAAIAGILIAVYLLAAYLGMRKNEKSLEE